MANRKIKSAKKAKLNVEKIKSKDCPRNEKQYPAISFLYLTKNSKHDFSRFSDTDTVAFMEACKSITECTYQEHFLRRKRFGFETIPYSQVRFEPSGRKTTPEEKIIVYQFDGHKKRLLGIKDGSCATLHVVGIDHDFSAYDHGS